MSWPSPNDPRRQPGTHSLVVRGLLSPNGFTNGEQAQTHLPQRAPLPLAELFTRSRATSFCCSSSIDEKGRLTDRTALRALGWSPGTQVSISMMPDSGVLVIRRHGIEQISPRGLVRVPLQLRRRLRLEAGDRLLLLALVQDDVLLAYLSSAIDRMVTTYHAGITEQERS